MTRARRTPGMRVVGFMDDGDAGHGGGRAGSHQPARRKRKRFAQRRKALGLTQEALADLLGVERSTVVRWESGETEPLPWIRPKLAKALQVSADRLGELLASGLAGEGRLSQVTCVAAVRGRSCRGTYPRRSRNSPAAPWS